MNIYWGDLHNHCGITYGYGSLENALKIAKQHLDFCSVTGHAMWPDIPERKPGLEFLVDFHKEGFNKLSKNWDAVRKKIADYNKSGDFVTFQGYEMHSSKYGDHHLISMSDELPLIYADSPKELIKMLYPLPVMIIPHHISYTPRYRGINWEKFSEAFSPVVEVFSKHGCGMSDNSPYPYYHDMGPRDSRSSVYAGIQKGLKFGFIASTDHHAGFPGSYGDGKMAVLAEEKTRSSIWNAIKNRCTYAVTGDKIICTFKINGVNMGGVVEGYKNRQIDLNVVGSDVIEKIVVYKNQKPWRFVYGEELVNKACIAQKYKIRVEMGWGNSNKPSIWNGDVNVKNGRIGSVEPCFRGMSILAPRVDMSDDFDINTHMSMITEESEAEVYWKCCTFKNLSTLHPQTSSVVLEVEGDMNTELKLDINNKVFDVCIRELLEGSLSKHLKSYNSEAFLVHRAVPEYMYSYKGSFFDNEDDGKNDVYYMEVKQYNGQCAWVSPIYTTKFNSF